MAVPSRHQHRIARLRARIARLEAAAAPRAPAVCTGDPGLPPVAPGILQEVWAADRRGGGAALGFALGQARALIGAERPEAIWLQLAHEAGEAGLPYAAGLAGFGFDPGRLVLVRAASVKELLWAAEEAAGCRAVAAVLAEIGGAAPALGFTASRRLALRAGAAGGTVIVIRYGGARAAGAAALRWRIEPAASAPAPYDARAPGRPRWRAVLERRTGAARGLAAADGKTFDLEWTGHGFAEIAGDGGSRRPAAAPGALPAALGDRLPRSA